MPGDFFFFFFSCSRGPGLKANHKWEVNLKERNLNPVKVPGARKEALPHLKSASSADKLGGPWFKERGGTRFFGGKKECSEGAQVGNETGTPQRRPQRKTVMEGTAHSWYL